MTMHTATQVPYLLPTATSVSLNLTELRWWSTHHLCNSPSSQFIPVRRSPLINRNPNHNSFPFSKSFSKFQPFLLQLVMETSAVFFTALFPCSRTSIHLRSSPPPFSTKPPFSPHLRSPPPPLSITSNPYRHFVLTQLPKPIRPFSAPSSNNDDSITKPPNFEFDGAKIVPLAISLAIGLIVRFLPIIKSLSLSAGSMPNDPSAKKLGSYLIQSQFQCSGNSSALFLTAAAQNLLCLQLAEELGVVVADPWVEWFTAASLPAVVSLLLTPYILYKLYPPETKDTPDAPAMAAKKLDLMGPVTTNEWVMIGTMLLALSLWIFGAAIGISSVLTAMIALSILLLLGVLKWEDCLNENSAWDTLAWFAVLVGMASQLTNLGIVTWMSNYVAIFLQSFSLSWPVAFGVLQAAYFLIHYMFASQTGHVGALYPAFLAMHLAAGVPGVLSALALAYNTNLFGALTHYSSGQAAVYFGAGYVDLPDIFRIGFTMACVNAVIWGVVGSFWWKILELY